MTPFDIKNCIDQKTATEPWDEQWEKDYNAYIINRAMSFNQQTVLFASELTRLSFLDKKMQFDFYYYGVPKGKRFDKWIKQDSHHADVAMLQGYYSINTREAEQLMGLLTAAQLSEIRTITRKGGRK